MSKHPLSHLCKYMETCGAAWPWASQLSLMGLCACQSLALLHDTVTVLWWLCGSLGHWREQLCLELLIRSLRF